MSMVFNSAKASNMYCPTCREDNGDDFAEDDDIECRKCKMVYRRSISWTSPKPLPSYSMTTAQMTPSTVIQPADVVITEDISFVPRKRKAPLDEDEEMALFRRVRIKTSIVLPAPDSRPGSPNSEGRHNDIIKCICGFSHPRDIVSCTICRTNQHMVCYYGPAATFLSIRADLKHVCFGCLDIVPEDEFIKDAIAHQKTSERAEKSVSR